MPKILDLAKILKRSPNINPKKLEESRKLLLKLRNRGIRRSGYGLAPPFARRHPAPVERFAIRLGKSEESNPK
jgi:hypothetical protein